MSSNEACEKWLEYFPSGFPEDFPATHASTTTSMNQLLEEDPKLQNTIAQTEELLD